MDLTLLAAFAASFFLVALSPGLCMTLAMSLGISIGARRTLWMMAGELAGIALVGVAAVLGVAALLLKAPTVFAVPAGHVALYRRLVPDHERAFISLSECCPGEL